jgi:hypothetical protein
MFERIKTVVSLPKVFQEGKMVANPEAWKKGQITASLLAGFFASVIAIADLFGYQLAGISQEQLLTVATGIITAFGIFHPIATVISTDKIGTKPVEVTTQEPAPIVEAVGIEVK